MASLHELLVNKDAALYVASTGAGPGLVQSLWRNPGSSDYLVGFNFPYSKEELEQHLGYLPEKCFSKEVAIDMAISSYIKAKTACILQKNYHKKAFGVGVTASVASKQPHRGDHGAFIAIVSDGVFLLKTVTLEKGGGIFRRCKDNQEVEEEFLTTLKAALLGIPSDGSPLLTQLLAAPVFGPQGRSLSFDSPYILPGTFNPPHEGHLGLVKGMDAVFMLELMSPHKSPLTAVNALDRVAELKALKASVPLVVTSGCPLFTDKSNRFPGKTFIIGSDTYHTMFEMDDGIPKWGLTQEECEDIFLKNQTKFLVSPRPTLPYFNTEIFNGHLPSSGISSTKKREDRRLAHPKKPWYPI